MFVEDFDAVLLREVGEHAAVLRIVEPVFEDFFRGTARGFGAAPVDVNESAPGHPAEPTAGLDHEDTAALARGGDGGGDPRGIAGVNADIGGEGATFGSTKRQQRTHGDHAAEADELSPVRWRGQMSGGAHQNVLVAERRKLRGVV